MLVLTRKLDEKIMIGDDIVLTIIDLRNDGVRIGIEAPRDVKVHRAEVVDAVSSENRIAADSAADIDAEALRRLLAANGGQLTVTIPTSETTEPGQPS